MFDIYLIVPTVLTVKYSENDEKIFTFTFLSFINLNMSKYE